MNILKMLTGIFAVTSNNTVINDNQSSTKSAIQRIDIGSNETYNLTNSNDVKHENQYFLNGLNLNLKDQDSSKLQTAAQTSSLKVVNQDIESGAALMYAISSGRKDLALEILENNDVNVNFKNENGNTPLMAAIATKQVKIALKILEKDNVNVNIQDKERHTALMYAIDKKVEFIALKILEKDNINVNLQNKYDETALIIASQNSQLKAASKIGQQIC